MRAWSANSMSFSRRLGCLISEARSRSVSRSPYSLISSAAVLTPMPGTPGTLSVESPASDCTSTTLSGGTPNFSITSSRADLLGLHGVEHDNARAHELHQVLVGGDDRDVAAGVDDLARVGRDEVVGLIALLLDAGDVERLHRVADERELRDELVGRRRPVRLVVLEDLVAEVLAAGVENDRDVGRRLRRLRLAQELPQHGAEAVHGADGQAVGGSRQGRERVEGAEDVARAVDEVDVAALDDGRRLAVGHGRDGGVLRLALRVGLGLGWRRLLVGSWRGNIGARHAAVSSSGGWDAGLLCAALIPWKLAAGSTAVPTRGRRWGGETGRAGRGAVIRRKNRSGQRCRGPRRSILRASGRS